MFKCKCALIICIMISHSALILAGPPLPPSLSEVDLLPNYYDKINDLLLNCVCNHQVKSTFKMWDPLKYDIKKSFDNYAELILGNNTWFAKYTGKGDNNPEDTGYYYTTEDEVYRIHMNEKTRSPFIKQHLLEWEKPKEYLLEFKTLPPVKSQVFFFSDAGKFVSRADAEFEGRPTIKLEFIDSRQTPLTVHLDRQTYQFLYSEKPKSFDMVRQELKDEKLITRTTYRDVGGKRLPEKYEQYQLKADGQKLPQIVIEFSEYTPYTPTADELDMEKRFGLKPIPHEPRPASAKPKSRGWGLANWLYIGSGILFVLAIGMYLLFRRKRETQ
jgi:hypothetical protein